MFLEGSCGGAVAAGRFQRGSGGAVEHLWLPMQVLRTGAEALPALQQSSSVIWPGLWLWRLHSRPCLSPASIILGIIDIENNNQSKN